MMSLQPAGVKVDRHKSLQLKEFLQPHAVVLGTVIRNEFFSAFFFVTDFCCETIIFCLQDANVVV